MKVVPIAGRLPAPAASVRAIRPGWPMLSGSDADQSIGPGSTLLPASLTPTRLPPSLLAPSQLNTKSPFGSNLTWNVLEEVGTFQKGTFSQVIIARTGSASQ